VRSELFLTDDAGHLLHAGGRRIPDREVSSRGDRTVLCRRVAPDLTGAAPRREVGVFQATARTLSVLHVTDGGTSIVRLVGEVDLSADGHIDLSCFDGNDAVIDLSETTFMDCSGYRILLTAQRRLENSGAA